MARFAIPAKPLANSLHGQGTTSGSGWRYSKAWAVGVDLEKRKCLITYLLILGDELEALMRKVAQQVEEGAKQQPEQGQGEVNSIRATSCSEEASKSLLPTEPLEEGEDAPLRAIIQRFCTEAAGSGMIENKVIVTDLRHLFAIH